MIAILDTIKTNKIAIDDTRLILHRIIHGQVHKNKTVICYVHKKLPYRTNIMFI